jgi:hypothetical protein
VKRSFDRHPRGFEVGKGMNNIAVFHVSGRVIVGAHYEDPSVAAVAEPDGNAGLPFVKSAWISRRSAFRVVGEDG